MNAFPFLSRICPQASLWIWSAILGLVILPTLGCERLNTPVGPTRLRGRIVYQSFINFTPQILSMHPDDPDNTRQLTTLTDNVAPRWSPDGTRIAFLSDREGLPGFFRLYVMNDDGSNVRGLFDPVLHDEGDLEFSWSPDGTHIALVNRVTPIRADRRQLYIMNVETLERQLVAPSLPNRYSPDWSPDGTRIAFVSNDPRNGSIDLHILSYPTLSLQLVNVGRRRVNFPRWSPDGQHLAFVAIPDDVSDVFQVFVADGPTYQVRQVTHLPGGIPEPAPVSWSPDSERIMFAAPGTNRFLPDNRDLYAIRRDGSELVRITSNPNDELSPDWTFHD
jgi:Tol biopolymer transport system component